jgi:hypothetical protein
MDVKPQCPKLINVAHCSVDDEAEHANNSGAISQVVACRPGPTTALRIDHADVAPLRRVDHDLCARTRLWAQIGLRGVRRRRRAIDGPGSASEFRSAQSMNGGVEHGRCQTERIDRIGQDCDGKPRGATDGHVADEPSRACR